MTIHQASTTSSATDATVEAGAAAASPTEVDPTVLDITLDDLPIGETRLARVDGRRVCVARTPNGVFAVDHACPHEGYGLTQGKLDGNLLTCAWHNWKFDVTTGACVLGRDDVGTHHVAVDDDGAIAVRLRPRDPIADLARAEAGLVSAIEVDDAGQIARETTRLLGLGADPRALVTVGALYGAPRAEYGWGHSIAGLTDALAMMDLFDGDQRVIPLTQGLSFVAETERGRPERPLPAPRPRTGDDVGRTPFLDAVESEDLEVAQSILLGAIESGASPSELHAWLLGAVSAHHLSYGHGAIYAQKGVELLDQVGWEHAPSILGHLVTSIVYGTREDSLPYYRPFGREIDARTFDALVEAVVTDPDPSAGPSVEPLRLALLGPDRAAAATAAVSAITDGVSLDRVLDVVVDVGATRMLRHDTAVDDDLDDDFGWLDITHAITYAHAARFHLARRRSVGDLDDADVRSQLLRLTLFCAFQANWTGRHEWHTTVADEWAGATPVAPGDRAAIEEYGIELQRRSFDDVHDTYIHVVHDVKTSRAAHLEAMRTGDPRVLQAIERSFVAPRRERSIRSTAHRSIEFVAGRLRR